MEFEIINKQHIYHTSLVTETTQPEVILLLLKLKLKNKTFFVDELHVSIFFWQDKWRHIYVDALVYIAPYRNQASFSVYSIASGVGKPFLKHAVSIHVRASCIANHSVWNVHLCVMGSSLSGLLLSYTFIATVDNIISKYFIIVPIKICSFSQLYDRHFLQGN